jgi:hypothetical protein
MKKINFQTDVLPHAIAVVVFLLVTILFFRPVFFSDMAINQGDINQHIGASKELTDFRKTNHEEGLWAGSVFSGMPAYMISLDWSDEAVTAVKYVMALFLPHPVRNTFLAFICYYIMLLSFRVRPFLAITGAIAFGLSSFMIVGIGAGHNSRIGAMAFMPLAIAGIHLTFTSRKLLGFAVTALGMSLQLRENHLQMTYYLAMIVGVYGLVELISAVREKKLPEFAKTIGLLVGAVILAAGTFFGQLWAASEMATYSRRGGTDLTSTSPNTAGTGLAKSYAFEYSNGILEPMTLLIPNFYGGGSGEALVSDENSNTYKALMGANDNRLANQLAQYSSAYWGPQPLATPYYAGAIIVFMFVLGITLAEKKYVWWLVSVGAFAIMLSWGSNFESFNYFVFDHLPGYNKFRSVTFALIIVFIAMPLLGCLGVEKFLNEGLTPQTKKKLLIAFGVTGGLCLLLVLIPGVFDFRKAIEDQMPVWFTNALQADRKSLLRGDAIRSLGFIIFIFIMLYFNVPKRISATGFFALLAFMVTLDLAIVDSRYFSKQNYVPKALANDFTATAADNRISADKSYYRVFNLNGFYEATTSYHHNSLGGYSGVRLKRYQELYDSVISREAEELFTDAGAGPLNMAKYGVLNMLNAKYLIYGQEANQVLQNPAANGNAWFPNEIQTVNSANEELTKIAEIDTRRVAVIDQTKMKLQAKANTDSAAFIHFVEQKPYWQKYEAESASGGLGIFSEIYYPIGWKATIDGQDASIYRADYTLRALEIPSGKHTIEFTFAPRAYIIGNKVTMVASVLLILVVVGVLFMELRQKPEVI